MPAVTRVGFEAAAHVEDHLVTAITYNACVVYNGSDHLVTAITARECYNACVVYNGSDHLQGKTSQCME